MNEQERINAERMLDELMENLTPRQEKTANIAATIMTSALFIGVLICFGAIVFRIVDAIVTGL